MAIMLHKRSTLRTCTHVHCSFDHIVGSGSGIGREVCRILAREGAQVVATDQNVSSAEETVATLENCASAVLCS